jgi:hypothetical protein
LSAGSREGNILDVSIFRNVKEIEAAKERVSELVEKSKNKNRAYFIIRTYALAASAPHFLSLMYSRNKFKPYFGLCRNPPIYDMLNAWIGL